MRVIPKLKERERGRGRGKGKGRKFLTSIHEADLNEGNPFSNTVCIFKLKTSGSRTETLKPKKRTST